MDDEQLYSLRQDPSPEFAARLRADLKRHDALVVPARARWPIARIAAGVAVIVGAAGLFAVPAVRASAQSFLALFRVVNFVAVPVDDSRIDMLKARQLDPPHLIGEQVQVLQEAGAPTLVASPEQAGALAGMDVQLPHYLPQGMTAKEIAVRGASAAQITADTRRLKDVMDTLSITDLSIPEGLDGQVSTIRVPPAVIIKYEQGPRVTRFYQGRTPEVSMPASVDLASLGEIGLRILGLSPNDARQFSRAISWQTTLLVPVPTTISSFKQVDVHGHGGIAVERWVPSPTATPRTAVNVVLWAADGRVFGIESTQRSEDVLLMANSVR
ncbi:MAG TPA: hypothetical protein VGF24_17620 [Vicinamibacterales bacterium]